MCKTNYDSSWHQNRIFLDRWMCCERIKSAIDWRLHREMYFLCPEMRLTCTKTVRSYSGFWYRLHSAAAKMIKLYELYRVLEYRMLKNGELIICSLLSVEIDLTIPRNESGVLYIFSNSIHGQSDDNIGTFSQIDCDGTPCNMKWHGLNFWTISKIARTHLLIQTVQIMLDAHFCVKWLPVIHRSDIEFMLVQIDIENESTEDVQNIVQLGIVQTAQHFVGDHELQSLVNTLLDSGRFQQIQNECDFTTQKPICCKRPIGILGEFLHVFDEFVVEPVNVAH